MEYACGHRDRIDGEVDADSCLKCAFGAGAETTLMEAHCSVRGLHGRHQGELAERPEQVRKVVFFSFSGYIFELGCFMNVVLHQERGALCG